MICKTHQLIRSNDAGVNCGYSPQLESWRKRPCFASSFHWLSQQQHTFGPSSTSCSIDMDRHLVWKSGTPLRSIIDIFQLDAKSPIGQEKPNDELPPNMLSEENDFKSGVHCEHGQLDKSLERDRWVCISSGPPIYPQRECHSAKKKKKQPIKQG